MHSLIRTRPTRLAVVLVAAIATVTFLLLTQRGVSADAPAGARVEPVVSAATSVGEFQEGAVALLGAASAGAPGEAWAFQNLTGSTPAPAINSARLPFAPVPANSAGTQPVFLRHTNATGWQIYETPDDGNGQPLDKFSPVYSSASVTPRGGGALIGKTGIALVRQPGGRFTVNTPPTAANGLQAGEKLAKDNRAPTAAFDLNGKTAVLATATGSAVEGIVYFNGSNWSRDTVQLPAGSEGSFEVLALDATGPSNAWLLARLDPALNSGIALFQRVPGTGDAAQWEQRDLGNSLLENADSLAQGVRGLAALTSSSTGGTDPLTVTSDGVWIDGDFEPAGEPDDTLIRHDFTTYFDFSQDRLTAVWCDALDTVGALTARPLGVSFSREPGYRSSAWAGDGFGSRVVTNPVDRGTTRTNRGTFLTLGENGQFVRASGAGYADKVTSALRTASDGWLSSSVKFTTGAAARSIASWSVGARAPFHDVAAAPGQPVAEMGAGALAVGDAGGVARYQPSDGWVTEFLQSSTGLVRRPNLRGVAWPEPTRAHAVGDDGEMWMWRKETGLWERDAGAPLGIEAHLNDIAFDQNDAYDGYAVGRSGTLLRYGKSWTRVCPPSDHGQDCDSEASHVLPAALANADLRQIAYAGGDPLVISDTDLLVRRSGNWQVDGDVHALITQYKARTNKRFALLTVAGLPDGGAMIAGTGGFALKRESTGAPWTPLEQPLSTLSITETALFREGGKLRALVSAVLNTDFPPDQSPGIIDPGSPAPLLDSLAAAPEGFLLRETATGWTDEQRNAFTSAAADIDRPAKSEPVLGILAGASGDAWVVGGVNGTRDTANNGSEDSSQRRFVKTAFIGRYSAGGAPPAGQGAQTPVTQAPGTINFVVGGHAVCENVECQQFRHSGIAPDRQLETALAKTAEMAGQQSGPRFFMYTGGRRPANAASAMTAQQAGRFAELLGSQPNLPTYTVASAGDTTGGGAAAYSAAFAGFAEPLGDGAPPAPIEPRGDATGTRTHYAFNSFGSGGTLRVIVIDNSRGSLAASDPYQNPAVGPSATWPSQEAWLRAELQNAKSTGMPAIVVGSRDLHSSFSPKLNRANDAQQIATLLRDEGASAYFFDRPEENRQYSIPAGSADAIPSFGTGTLGYRSELESIPAGTDAASAFFGNTGMLLVHVDAGARDPSTNRAPVGVRMIPLIDNLNLEAIDGTLLRRSRPALFSGLGRRPVAGDRWGVGDPPSPAGSDPYTTFPLAPCVVSACSTRVEPEYEFHSSDPDIADFVAVDPLSGNTRKPLLNAAAKPITDARSGLLCPYNAGTTTLTITSGGMTYARQVTVQPGSVRPPCGTVPLDPKRFPAKQPAIGSPAPPPPPPVSPALALTLPVLQTPVSPAKPAKPAPRPPYQETFTAVLEPLVAVPVIPPPPAPSLARPIPPTGGMARAPEKQREEEAATEDSQAFARYEPNAPSNAALPLGALIVLAAFAGAALPRRRRGSGGGRAAPAYTFGSSEHSQRRTQR